MINERLKNEVLKLKFTLDTLKVLDDSKYLTSAGRGVMESLFKKLDNQLDALINMARRK